MQFLFIFKHSFLTVKYHLARHIDRYRLCELIVNYRAILCQNEHHKLNEDDSDNDVVNEEKNDVQTG